MQSANPGHHTKPGINNNYVLTATNSQKVNLNHHDPRSNSNSARPPTVGGTQINFYNHNQS
jgi:hypothetical protein